MHSYGPYGPYGYAHRRYQRIQLRKLSAELHKQPWLLQGPHDWTDAVWWWVTQSWRRPT